MHIRRLGLLLIEVALAEPIEVAWGDDNEVMSDVFFASNTDAENSLACLRRFNIVRDRIEVQTNADLSNAIALGL